jgi:hypothetical protein
MPDGPIGFITALDKPVAAGTDIRVSHIDRLQHRPIPHAVACICGIRSGALPGIFKKLTGSASAIGLDVDMV